MIFKALKFFLISITGIILSLCFALSSDFFTELIFETVDQHVDGIAINYRSGNIYDGLEFNQLGWEQSGLSLALNDFKLSLDWVCISKTQLCIENVSAEKLRLNLDSASLVTASEPEPESESSKASWLPPFPLILQQLQVNDAELHIDDLSVAWHTFKLGLLWEQDLITVGPLEFDQWQVELAKSDPSSSTEQSGASSELDPLLQLSIPDISLPYRIAINDLRFSNGQVIQADQRYQFELLELDAHADYQMLFIERFLLDSQWAKLQLQGEQQLHSSFYSRLKGQVEYDFTLEQKRLANKLSFSLDGDGVQGTSLRVDNKGAIAIGATAHVAWLKQSLPFSLDLELLKPLVFDTQDLSVELFNASAKGSLKGYEAEFDTRLAALERLALSAKVVGDTTQLSQFTVLGTILAASGSTASAVSVVDTEASAAGLLANGIKQAKGDFSIAGDMAWSPALKIKGLLELNHLHLSELIASPDPQLALPDINGDVQFSLDQQVWTVSQGMLEGEWLSLPLQLSLSGFGDLNLQNHEVDLGLDLGDSHLQAAAKIKQKTIDMTADLNSPTLGELPWFEMGGLNLSMAAKGALDKPDLTWQLALQEFKHKQISLEKLVSSGEFFLNDILASNLELELQKLQAVGQELDHAKLSFVGGDLQTFGLDASSPIANLQLNAQGQGSLEKWDGEVSQVNLSSDQGLWQLSSPVFITHSTALTSISAHCWQQLPSKLCLQQNLLLDGNSVVDVELTNLDFTSLNTFLPESVSLEGGADAQLFIQLEEWKASEAKFALNLDAGKVISKYDDQEFPITYKMADLQGQLSDEQLNFSGRLDAGELGHLSLQGFTGLSADSDINASLDLRELHLEPLTPLLANITELDGTINSQINVSGQALDPQLDGQLIISDAAVSGPDIPLAINQLNTELYFHGQQAELKGGFLSSGKKAEWHGNLAWSEQALQGHIQLDGDRLPIVIDPMASLEVSPSLAVDIAPELLKVSGEVVVDKGLVKIKSLPASAVAVSNDVIVIEEETEKSNGLALALDVQVNLGENLQLIALGLDTDLRGHLRLQQQPKEPLLADGRIELYEGSFKAYGQNLLIEKGWLVFAGSIEQPYIDIQAVRNPLTIEDDVVAGVKVVGLADAPQVSIYSEPAMSQNEALSYLLRGKALDDNQTENNAFSSMLLGAGIDRADGLVSTVGNTFGIEDLSVATSGSGDATQVEVSAYILPGVEVRYGMGVFEPVNELTVKYELFPKLFIEAFSGLNSALDVYYEFYLD